jgi:hypothetical protein
MSDLSNDTKKHTTKSRETIPLSKIFFKLKNAAQNFLANFFDSGVFHKKRNYQCALEDNLSVTHVFIKGTVSLTRFSTFGFSHLTILVSFTVLLLSERVCKVIELSRCPGNPPELIVNNILNFMLQKNPRNTVLI